MIVVWFLAMFIDLGALAFQVGVGNWGTVAVCSFVAGILVGRTPRSLRIRA